MLVPSLTQPPNVRRNNRNAARRDAMQSHLPQVPRQKLLSVCLSVYLPGTFVNQQHVVDNDRNRSLWRLKYEILATRSVARALPMPVTGR